MYCNIYISYTYCIGKKCNKNTVLPHLSACIPFSSFAEKFTFFSTSFYSVSKRRFAFEISFSGEKDFNGGLRGGMWNSSTCVKYEVLTRHMRIPSFTVSSSF